MSHTCFHVAFVTRQKLPPFYRWWLGGSAAWLQPDTWQSLDWKGESGAPPTALHFFHKCQGQLDTGIPFKLQSKWLLQPQWLFEILSCSLVSFPCNKGETWHTDIIEEDTYLDLKRHPQIIWLPYKLRQTHFCVVYLLIDFFQVWVLFMDLVIRSLALLTFVLL